MAVADLTQQFNQAQIAAQTRFIELGRAATPVVLRECSYALGLILPVSRPETMGE